jgi:soluble lytic murein transglycosylase
VRRRLAVVALAAPLLAIPISVLLLFVLLVPTGLFWSLARPALHKDIINRYAAEYKIDPLFVMALVKAESGFSRVARSHRGAVGLMQLMPETGLEMARRAGLSFTAADLENPEVNIHLGVQYLFVLRQEFKDDSTAVLAAYNAGPTNVRAWRRGGRLRMEEVPFPETRDFILRVRWTHAWLKRFQRVKNVFA